MPRVSPNVKYGFRVIMMFHCRFIDFDKCWILIIGEGVCVCGGAGGGRGNRGT